MRVLLIAPEFYDFEKCIINAIEYAGCSVDFYTEKPNENMLYRVLQKLNTNLFEKYLDSYFAKVINQTALKEYHLILVIRAEKIQPKWLIKLKEQQKQAKFIMYQWDFAKNLPLLKHQIDSFDHIYTFDGNDAKNYGFILKPLFFTNEHKKMANKSNSIKYDLSFVGAHHSDRFEFIQEMNKLLPQNHNRFFWYLYRSKLSYFYSKYCSARNIGKVKLKDIDAKILQPNETLKILAASNVILDMHHVEQNGLTIRSLEAIGLKKKLITTNPSIKNYNFYNDNNVLFINRDNPVIPQGFFDRKYKMLSEDVYNAYCVTEWVKEFLVH